MKKLLRIILSSILLSIILIVSLVMPVLAIDDPDVPPTLPSVYIYEDLIEDGDLGMLAEYYIDYTVAGTPTEPVSQSYLVIFIDTDGTTQLRAVAPYPYEDNGYYRGYAWIYFSAADVTAYSLDSADEALYSMWIRGNPTVPSGWTGDPPSGTGVITEWHTTGDSAVLLAQRVLNFSFILNTEWAPTDIVESTPVGNALTDEGESYWTNVIPNLRIMAPACFSDRRADPTYEDLDYTTSFGATATSGTATIAGSPVTLAAGANTITANTTGDFTLTLNPGTYGTIADDTGTISTSPSNLVPGDNVITVTGVGDLTVTVNLGTVQQTLTDEVTGTGLDLTTIATVFGMSGIAFSGIIWALLTILICGATYVSTSKLGGLQRGAGNITMFMAIISLIGGTLLGLLDVRIVALLAIGYGALIGYMLFFRTSADIGRTVMFMGWMWFVVCLVGGVLTGIVPQASATLASDLTATGSVITVDSTEGFPTDGIIVIEDERIAYAETTATTFEGTTWRPLIRGAEDTEAVAHTAIDPDTGKYRQVRMREGAILNNALNYNMALLSDSSGFMLFVTLPVAVIDIVSNFITLPLSFLGTDMVILTYIWALIGLGLIVSIAIAMVGGRRV